jgi:hypothetical protein
MVSKIWTVTATHTATGHRSRITNFMSASDAANFVERQRSDANWKDVRITCRRRGKPVGPVKAHNPDHDWTPPFHGVTHLGKLSTTEVWASVTDYEGFAVLHINRPGKAFHPDVYVCGTVEEAKRTAERHIVR